MDTIGIHGIITLHEIPDWTDEEFKYWWCPATDMFGHILRHARISDEAKAQRIVLRSENILTNTGIALFLNDISVTGQGSMYPFSQILSVGNGTFTGATRALTGVSGDGFGTNSRKATASFAVTGFSTTITTNYASGDANGTWTNIGFYGFNTNTAQNATTTAGTGSLMTIAPFPFTKGATAYAVNYVFLLSN